MPRSSLSWHHFALHVASAACCQCRCTRHVPDSPLGGQQPKQGDRVAVHYEARWHGVTFLTSRQVQDPPPASKLQVPALSSSL